MNLKHKRKNSNSSCINGECLLPAGCSELVDFCCSSLTPTEALPTLLSPPAQREKQQHVLHLSTLSTYSKNRARAQYPCIARALPNTHPK